MLKTQRRRPAALFTGAGSGSIRRSTKQRLAGSRTIASRTPKGALSLILLLSVTAAHAQTPGDPAKGKALFEACAACHSLAPDDNGSGPTLAGLFGRPSAAIDAFNYSAPMRRANATWTPEVLDGFLADPQAPPFRGNRMPFAAMSDPDQRRDLIAYLQQAAQH